jgi:hypothetical protein
VAHYFIFAITIWLGLNVAFVALRLWVTRPIGHRAYAGGYQLSEIRVRRDLRR